MGMPRSIMAATAAVALLVSLAAFPRHADGASRIGAAGSSWQGLGTQVPAASGTDSTTAITRRETLLAPAAAWGAKKLVVVLSDLHIGDGSPTQVYQPYAHEGYLLAILNDIVAKNATIAELVLAGDTFDFWNYPFDVRPPSLSSILASNPNLFGINGGFARVLDALQGQVTFIPGDHDLLTTAADVALIRSPGGYAVKFAASAYSPGGDKRVLIAHGHQASLFNAPGTTRWAPLPMGHFISRIQADFWARTLAPGQTVADLPANGAPSAAASAGYFLPIVQRLAAGNISVAPQVLDAYATIYQANRTAPIILPDGTTTTLTVVSGEYSNLFFFRFLSSGQAGAVKALTVDYDGSYMGWFAMMQALQARAGLIVYGHTHTPVRGFANPVVANYINTGSACPAVPDLASGAKQVNFLTIDMTTLQGALSKVTRSGSTYSISRDASPDTVDVVEGETQDYSTYAVIDNSVSTLDLTLVPSATRQDGTFIVLPPASIKAGEKATVWVQNDPAPPLPKTSVVSGGTFTYRARKTSRTKAKTIKTTWKFSFSSPATRLNAASGGSSILAKSGFNPWQATVPKYGYPLYVHFTV